MNKLNFLERAALLGHDTAALQAGQQQFSEISVPDIDSFKALIHNGDSNEQAREESTMAQATVTAMPYSSTDEPMPIAQKMHAYVHNNGSLSQADRAALSSFFPMKVMAVSAMSANINSPTTWGVESQPILLNYGTVTLQDTGVINIQGVPTTITMDNFVRMGNAPTTMGDINILGIRGIDGMPGGPGPTGPNGMPNCNGGSGGYGGYGSDAMDGRPSQEATINIVRSIQSSSPIVVYTSSGAGGNGGNGGKGGNGGNGGSASPIPTYGGNGGNGGGGGRGGSSPDAQGNVMVYVNSAYTNNVKSVSVNTPPGAGGIGGDGGAGGSGSGQSGQKGAKGPDGPAGGHTGIAAKVYIRPY
jgi:hypothetical protein